MTKENGAQANQDIQSHEEKTPPKYVNPYSLKTPPLDYIVIHNRSKNAANFAITQLKKAWPKLKIIQVVEEERDKDPGADEVIRIQSDKWSDMAHFKERFDQLPNIEDKKVGFYSVWSAAAESADWARAAQQAGFHWIGASPDKMDGLDKISYKTRCQKLGLPTAEFFEVKAAESKGDKEASIRLMAQNLLDQYQKSELKDKAIFVKHNEGGGGRGSQKVDLSDMTVEHFSKVITQVVNDTGGHLEGVYVERALDLKDCQLFQIEIEGDGSEIAYGGRLVWFNKANQKVLEVGLSDEAITKLIPQHIYDQCKAASKAIFTDSGYDNRGTNEILLVRDKDGNWSFYNSELNKRMQVENRALADLVIDERGNPKNIPAEQVMRSLGFPAPKESDFRKKGAEVIAHLRLLSCGIDPKTGKVRPTEDLYIDDAITPPGGPAVQFVKGPVYPEVDSQLGSALIEAQNWEEFCDKLLQFAQDFQFIGPNTDQSDYFELIKKLASDPRFRSGELGCNQTLEVLANEAVDKGLAPKVVSTLTHSVTPLVVQGYRPGEGVQDQTDPTDNQVKEFNDNLASLKNVPLIETPFSRFKKHGKFDQYIIDLKEWLKQHGGGSVAVIRDVQQSQADSESALIQDATARIAERHFAASGIGVGFEVGGAQYQKALMNGIDWWSVLLTGCLSNLPSHSLTRSAWLNGLDLKPLAVQEFVFKTIRDEVCQFYGIKHEMTPFVPWFPYNFHAGNHPKQDITTRAMLRANLGVIPNWAWDPEFTEDHFKSWILRQIKLFKEEGKPLSQIRIKNPGQGQGWTADAIQRMVEILLQQFKEQGEGVPIIFIHNHDFDGAGARIGAEALKLCREKLDYHYLVVDSAPPGTSHNSNVVLSSALETSDSEKEHLKLYNQKTRSAINLTKRFNNQNLTQDLLDPYSGMAGGTISSDYADAIKIGIPVKFVDKAKALAKKLLRLVARVTPFSEWIKKIGFAIWKNEDIKSKTVEGAEAYINKGGKLLIADDILKGLQDWETLVPRPAIVEKLLKNHGMALEPQEVKEEPVDIEMERRKLQKELGGIKINDKDLSTYLAFGRIGLDFLKRREGLMPANGPRELTALSSSPGFVYKQARKKGDSFMLYGEKVTITRVDRNEDGSVNVDYNFRGYTIRNKGFDQSKIVAVVTEIIRKVKDKKLDIGIDSPAKIVEILVKPGMIVKPEAKLMVVEVMKSHITLTAPPKNEQLPNEEYVVDYVRDPREREGKVSANELLVGLKLKAPEQVNVPAAQCKI